MRKQQWEKPQARRVWKSFEFVYQLHPGMAVEAPSTLGAGSSVVALQGSVPIRGGLTSSYEAGPALLFSLMRREIVAIMTLHSVEGQHPPHKDNPASLRTNFSFQALMFFQVTEDGCWKRTPLWLPTL